MPILDDIMDHDLLGVAIKRGMQKGLQQGLQNGRKEGRLEIVRRILQKRFGTAPEWIEARLVTLSPENLDEMAVNALDASSLEHLFSR